MKLQEPLVLILSKMSRYVKTFKDKGGDKNKNNKLMSLRIDDNKVLKEYKAIWTKTEDLKDIELNAFSVYDDRFIKTKIRTHGSRTDVPEDRVECKSFTVISTDSLLTRL